MAEWNGRYSGTIDWDIYWRTGDDDEYPASVGANKFDSIKRFFDTRGVPDDAAFVGCGRAELPVQIAKSYPEVSVTAYDAARSVLNENRERYSGLSNIEFEMAVLPAFPSDRQFEFVWTYATLHYVRKIEAAITNLYEAVHPGGTLVCNYPNQHTQRTHEDLDGDLRDRFALVVNGENTISKNEIEAVLGTEAGDFWTVTDTSGPFVEPGNPCIFVTK